MLNCLPLICLGGRADDHRVGGRHYFAISPPPLPLPILLVDLLATHFWICGSAQTWICRESSNIFPPGTLRGGGEVGDACYLQTSLSSWCFANSFENLYCGANIFYDNFLTISYSLKLNQRFALHVTLCLSLSSDSALPLLPISGYE